MNYSIKKATTLIILPIASFAIGMHYIFISGSYFLQSVDPDYSYLLNGLLIADLKLRIGFIFHPGTPMQCLAAAVIRVVHLFRPEYSLVQDVLLYPEMYIRAILHTVNTLNALALLFMGLQVYKISDTIHVAVFLQLTPFTQVLTLEVLRRLMPEPLMNLFVCGWIILIMYFIYEDSRNLNHKLTAFLFGLLFGICLADKLTFLPYFILPLVLLPKWRNRLIYVLFSVVSFLVFAFPVTLKIGIFYDWVKGIITHTGSYGSGDTGIFKWNEFVDHLRLQYYSTGILPGAVIVLFLVILGYIFKFRNLKSVKIKAAIALILVIMLEYLITSKHFAFHYMIPAILLTVICLLFVGILLEDMYPKIFSQFILKWSLIISGVFILAITIPRVIMHMEQIKQISDENLSAFKKAEPLLKQTPKIISASYYGCFSIEYALTCGIQMSDRYGPYLTQNLKELYPSTYIYFPWGKLFYEGNQEIQPSEFVKMDINYNIYAAEYSKKLMDEIMNAVTRDLPISHSAPKQIYIDSIHHEGIYHVRFNKNPKL